MNQLTANAMTAKIGAEPYKTHTNAPKNLFMIIFPC